MEILSSLQDQPNVKSSADQDSSVVLSVGAPRMEEEIKEEGKQDDDKIEHEELDAAAPAPSKEISQVPEVINAVVEIAKSIEKRLPVSTGHPRHKAPSTIYQVPRLLRQEDGSCTIYEPQLISIGPYHRGKIGLQAMEEKKLQHVREILSRNKEVKLEDYIKELMKLEKRAKECYSQSFSKIERDEFVEMMLLDGCFLVEIFLQNKDFGSSEIYNEMWLQDFIVHDMLLLENQLPYFTLECIFKLVVGDQKVVRSMEELALDCFKYIPVMPLNHAASVGNSYHHLVDLFHHHCLPTDSEINNSGRGGGMDSSIKTKFVRSMKDFMTSFFSREPKMHLEQQLPSQVPDFDWHGHKRISMPKLSVKPKAAVNCFMTNIAEPLKAVIDCATSFFRSSHEEMPLDKSDEQEPQRSIPSAEELEETGVVFKPKKKKENKGSFLHIEFHENGVIEIPYFNFCDGINSVFQNFMAFELCRYPDADTFFMGYVIFMDCLINTDKDVKILRRSGVLGVEGWGSDIELANVFNRMTRGVFWDATDTRFANLYKGINDYCRKKRNVWRANLMRNYFNTPWAFLSFVAALVLLILTMTQTFFSIFPRN